MWSKRSMKESQRRLFFEDCKVARHYLTLAGGDCADIQLGEKLNVLQPDVTAITAVEEDPYVYDLMSGWLERNWPYGNFCSLHAQLHRVRVRQPLDLAFLDYLGNITARDAKWITTLPLLPGATVGITTLRQARGNVFIPAVKRVVSNYGRYLDETCREVRDNGKYPPDLIPHIAAYIILLRCYLFPRASYRIAADYYGETKSPSLMCFFRVKDYQPTAAPVTYLEYQIQQEISNLVDEQTSVVYEAGTDRFRERFVMNETDIRGMDVIRAMQEATTPGKKAAATKLLRRYVNIRQGQGFNPVMVEAGIKARLTRIANGN